MPAGAENAVRTRKGRTPGGVQPTGCGPCAVTSP